MYDESACAQAPMFLEPSGHCEECRAKPDRSHRTRVLSACASAALYCDITPLPQRFPKRLLERSNRQVISKRWEGSPRTKAAWVPSSCRSVKRDPVRGEPRSGAIGGQIRRAGRRPQAGSSKPLRWDPVCAVHQTCGLPFYRLSAETGAVEARSRSVARARSFLLSKAGWVHLR